MEEGLTKKEWKAVNKLLSHQPDEEMNLYSEKDMQNMTHFLVTVSKLVAAEKMIWLDTYMLIRDVPKGKHKWQDQAGEGKKLSVVILNLANSEFWVGGTTNYIIGEKLNILVLGLANLLGGLILIIHNLQELREEEPRRTTTEDNQTGREEEEGRYKRLLGRRENFTLHASVAIISFIVVGLLPPVVYYFSFSEKHNKNYKIASVFGASLACIVWLAIAKAHVKYPRGSYLKSILYYATIAVSVSGISYVVGNFLDHLLEKNGWSDGSETPVGQMMLSTLMGRRAGSGYSSSY